MKHRFNMEPLIFWASIAAFLGSLAVSWNTNIDKDKLIQKVFFIFSAIYILRIYLGLLMVTYDESASSVILNSGERKVRWFHITFLAEIIICLMFSIFYEVWGYYAAFYLVFFESVPLLIFWLVFSKEFLLDDEDSQGNWITLGVDILSLVLVFVAYISIRYEFFGVPEHEYLFVGAAIAVTGLLILMVVVEIFFPYREGIFKFYKHTREVLFK